MPDPTGQQNQVKPVGCATIWLRMVRLSRFWFGAARSPTIWFGAASLWLFITAHMFDDIRHGSENLGLGFGIPFWLTATFFSTLVGRLFWICFPNFAPRSLHASSGWLSVGIGFGIALIIASIWVISPLFAAVYDSYKIILLMLIAGLLLGLIYKVGGRFSVWVSFLVAMIAALTAFLVFFVLEFSSSGSTNLVGAWSLAEIGLPYAISVSLYDCYRKASNRPK